jgi:acyl carrier protein
MEASHNALSGPDHIGPPTDIVEARALVTRLLRTIAPNVDLEMIDQYESLHDVADLDSLDFINLMSATAEATGVIVSPRDYPLVVTLDGFARYLLTHRTDAS